NNKNCSNNNNKSCNNNSSQIKQTDTHDIFNMSYVGGCTKMDDQYHVTHDKIQNKNCNKKKTENNKVDNSTQTHNDIIYNFLLNHENCNNLEIIWDKHGNTKIKGESFIFFLKTLLQLYKKELTMKNEEINLIEKLKQKKIDDIKEIHNIELANLKQKHKSEICFLKNQNVENIIKVRKSFENKLNNIEEDLMLDIDILTSQNKKAKNVSIYNKEMKQTKLITVNTTEYKEKYDQSDSNDGEDKSSNYESNKHIEYYIKKIKHLVNEKNKAHILNNEFIQQEMLKIKNVINSINIETEKKVKLSEANKLTLYQVLEFLEQYTKNIKNGEKQLNMNKNTTEQIKESICTIIQNIKLNNLKNETILNLINESTLISLLLHMISLFSIKNVKSEIMEIKKKKNHFIRGYFENENTSDSILNKENVICDKFEDNIETLSKQNGGYNKGGEEDINRFDSNEFNSNEFDGNGLGSNNNNNNSSNNNTLSNE
ncbi:hypothetical protein HEP_00496300, partial [Hepatocystis sp. ex Piliocolobus tephrosceles]